MRAFAALCMMALCAAVSLPAFADGAPAGWQRNDYIAYLILSDFLRDMSKGHGKIFTACISNAIGAEPQFADPTPQLLGALVTAFTARAGIRLLRASECEETTGEVRERKSGIPAMYVWVDESKRDPLSPGTPNGCGEFQVDWHHAALWGGGAYYHLLADRAPIAVERDPLCFIAE